MTFAKSLFKDQRDIPFLNVLALDLFVLIPLGVFLFTLPNVPWWLGLPYLGFVIYMLGPHLLMLHNVCHRPPVKKSLKTPFTSLMNFIGLFFGLPPHLYYLHHIKMHHREENSSEDLSSTEKYDRDNFFHWLHYFLTFVFLTPVLLPHYFLKRGKTKLALQALMSYVSFYLILGFAYQINSEATLYVFFLPTLICWFGLMSGNWTQHAFIDESDKENPYRNSITVVDSLYNKRCFNDGYHIGHHVNAGRHWTEMPEDFNANLEKYQNLGAIIFRKLDYQAIWFLLMTKRFDYLAKFLVSPQTHEEKVNFLKSRLKKTQSTVWESESSLP